MLDPTRPSPILPGSIVRSCKPTLTRAPRQTISNRRRGLPWSSENPEIVRFSYSNPDARLCHGRTGSRADTAEPIDEFTYF